MTIEIAAIALLAIIGGYQTVRKSVWKLKYQDTKMKLEFEQRRSEAWRERYIELSLNNPTAVTAALQELDRKHG